VPLTGVINYVFCIYNNNTLANNNTKLLRWPTYITGNQTVILTEFRNEICHTH